MEVGEEIRVRKSIGRGGQLAQHVAGLKYSQDEETSSSFVRRIPVRNRRLPSKFNNHELGIVHHTDVREQSVGTAVVRDLLGDIVVNAAHTGSS